MHLALEYAPLLPGYASALTETVLLGVVAYRTGHKLDWDSASLKARNSRQAMNYLHIEYRKGWEL